MVAHLRPRRAATCAKDRMADASPASGTIDAPANSSPSRPPPMPQNWPPMAASFIPTCSNRAATMHEDTGSAASTRETCAACPGPSTRAKLAVSMRGPLAGTDQRQGSMMPRDTRHYGRAPHQSPRRGGRGHA